MYWKYNVRGGEKMSDSMDNARIESRNNGILNDVEMTNEKWQAIIKNDAA